MEGAEAPWERHQGCVLGLVMQWGIATLLIEFPSMSSQRSQRSAAIRATFIRYIDKVTNKISNYCARRRARHQVSPPYRDALHPPSFTTRPRSPILISSRLEGSPMAENDASLYISEELTKQRTSSSLRNILQQLLTDSTQCRPGDINRYTPG